MMKTILLRASAAALAASVVLGAVAVPALAQPPGYRDNGQLAGAPQPQPQYPPLFSGQDQYRDNDRGDWRNSDWGRRKPDFQQVQRDCSRAGIQEAWNRDYYSAQYNDGPRLEQGRNGWEMRGQMRLQDRKGYSYANTVCEVGRNGNVRIDFDRIRR